MKWTETRMDVWHEFCYVEMEADLVWHECCYVKILRLTWKVRGLGETKILDPTQVEEKTMKNNLWIPIFSVVSLDPEDVHPTWFQIRENGREFKQNERELQEKRRHR